MSRSLARDVNATTESILETLRNANITDDVYLSSVSTTITTKNNILTEVINQKATESILAPEDKLRDNATRVVFLEVEAKLLSSNTLEQATAAIVYDVLSRYGLSMINKPYNEQTADLNAMLSDLDAPQVKEAIENLGTLKTSITNLQTIHNKWKATFQAYITKRIDISNTISATKLTPEIIDLVNLNLIIYIDAMAKANPDRYKPTFDRIVEIIEGNNSKVRNRLNRLKNEPALEE